MRLLMEHAEAVIAKESLRETLIDRVREEIAWCDAAESQLAEDFASLDGQRKDWRTGAAGDRYHERLSRIQNRRRRLVKLLAENEKDVQSLHLEDEDGRDERFIAEIDTGQGVLFVREGLDLIAEWERHDDQILPAQSKEPDRESDILPTSETV